MDVRERIRRARLIKKISEHAEYAERIGIVISNAKGPDLREVVEQNAKLEKENANG